MYKKLALSFGVLFLLLGLSQIYSSATNVSISQAEIEEIVSPSLSSADYEIEQQAILNRLKNEGLTETFSYIKERMYNNTAFARDCHNLMHYLGHESFHFNNTNFLAAMSGADEVCNSGYIHGAIQSYFIHNPDENELPGDICDLGGQWTYKKWQCAHGMGHGYFLASLRNPEVAISKCQILGSENSIKSCANGVYMEMFFLTDHTGGKTRTLSDAHISMCKNTSNYKGDCYLYAPTAFLEANVGSYWNATSDYCLESDSDYIATCQYGVGVQLMKDNITKPAVANTICSEFPSNIQNSCINGAIRSFFYNTGTTENYHETCTTFGNNENRCIDIATDLNRRLKF